MSKYQENGRPIVTIFQNGEPWTDKIYTIHTPKGIYRGLDTKDVVGMLTSYPFKPVIAYQGNVCGKARTHFRSAISHMPLPKGLTNIPQV